MGENRLASNSGLAKLLTLVALMVGGMMIGGVTSTLIWKLGGVDIAEVLNGASLDQNQRNVFRLGLVVNHAFTFLIPAFVFCRNFLKEDIFSYLRLKEDVSYINIAMWGLVILFSYPFIAQLTEWNTSIPLPDWLTHSQTDSFALLEQTLKMESIVELLISLLLVGVMAALGEELIFRGIIQEHLARKIGNPHIAIIIASVVFGGFHMQFERIIPLSFLGLILGYSYHYSKNLVVPIVLHLVNNSFQVLSIYFVTRTGDMPQIDEIPDLPLSLTMSSLILTLVVAYCAMKIENRKNLNVTI